MLHNSQKNATHKSRSNQNLCPEHAVGVRLLEKLLCKGPIHDEDKGGFHCVEAQAAGTVRRAGVDREEREDAREVLLLLLGMPAACWPTARPSLS
jgi:hypothetical protein